MLLLLLLFIIVIVYYYYSVILFSYLVKIINIQIQYTINVCLCIMVQ
jgi:hypothetical protein